MKKTKIQKPEEKRIQRIRSTLNLPLGHFIPVGASCCARAVALGHSPLKCQGGTLATYSQFRKETIFYIQILALSRNVPIV
ncbi:hypothetical protein [Brassicibacter mesophilus]|uniref:hypothetical protein n=1 Tax=Brassicibacter mesophilus TaxID=745119 RepID=UPI003D25AE60